MKQQCNQQSRSIPQERPRVFTPAEFDALTPEDQDYWNTRQFTIQERPYTIIQRARGAEPRRTLKDRFVCWLIGGHVAAIRAEVDQIKRLSSEDEKTISALASDLNMLRNEVRDMHEPQPAAETGWSSGRPLNRGNARTFVAERPRGA